MFNFFQDIVNIILNLQEKLLSKKLKGNLKSSFTISSSKRIFSQAASLELNSKTQKNKIKLETDLKTILAKYNNNPQKLLGFIRRSGTSVYVITFADKFLKLINCEEGLISSKKGIKGLYLNVLISLFCNKKLNLSLNTESMLIIKTPKPDQHFMIQQFHKWYAMKLNLPGFDSESQNNLEKFLSPKNDTKIKDLSIDEILGLKEAIIRDVESINFVIDLAKSTTGSKNALKKITTGGASV